MPSDKAAPHKAANDFEPDAIVVGSGAAGGLAYCLAVLGATITRASDYLADAVGLADAVAGADVVIAVGGPLTPATLDHGLATAAAKLASLKVDRQDLLSRYRPDSQPVREIDQKIAALQALIASGGADGVAARRTGINPVFQTLQTERNQTEAQAASLRQRLSKVNADLVQVDVALDGLEPPAVGDESIAQRFAITIAVPEVGLRETADARQIVFRSGRTVGYLSTSGSPQSASALLQHLQDVFVSRFVSL